MILAADTNHSEILSIFSSLGLEAAFLVPTETAMKKSIVDATSPTRQYLKQAQLHDYDCQELGKDHRVLKPAYFVESTSLNRTTCSLYRPLTKQGDPRIWFYNLKSYARAYNLLALIASKDSVYIINCSKAEVVDSLENSSSPIFKVLNMPSDGLTPEARELLGLLRNIGRAGWIPTLKPGDTGVGYTLESLLGITANSSKAPDYKGVEVKSSRVRSANQTLFGKTPDWKKSHLKSSLGILKKRGRFSVAKNRHQLFHSIYAPQENSYGLQLEVCNDYSLLKQYCNIAGRREDDVLWEISILQDALRKKHRQTFWVKTQTRNTNSVEEFFYEEGVYTRGPNVSAFPLLLEAGDVFVDYTIKQNPNGSAKDQGYLFRMKKNNLDVLFGKPKKFTLS
jgi:hypothetical protein